VAAKYRILRNGQPLPGLLDKREAEWRAQFLSARSRAHYAVERAPGNDNERT
jgi:hypothetical protein